MVRKASENTIEVYEKAMPEIYWRKHKKQTVDLSQDLPFALDRQLEDQRFTMERNRNPQLDARMKNDKVRSELIIKKKGAARPVAIKANVVNKIVREASGFHAYAIVPPPMTKKKAAVVKEVIDPDTHPLMKPYVNEANVKPIVKSFGHRPRSASRTFHPATMKIRLQHDEIAKTGQPGKTGFGLPPAILSKLLFAPKISYPGTMAEDNPMEGQNLAGASKATKLHDPNDLFLPHDSLFGESWVDDSDGFVPDSGRLESQHMTGNPLDGKDSSAFTTRTKKKPKGKKVLA